MEYSVCRYEDEKNEEWDLFIKDRACNATFLQSRRFLGYHPKTKFVDCSLMFYNGSELVAVCPACEIIDDGIKCFMSHAGSTYGGMVVSKTVLRFEKMMTLLEIFENYLRSNGYRKCILKQNNPVMDTVRMDLLEFCLNYTGYKEYKELDICIDYSDYDKNQVLSNFSKMKKRLTKKCLAENMRLVELSTKDELDRFLEILADNLAKYGLKPYHTTEDLLELKRRFSEEIKCWGCVYEGRIVAVSMVFLMEKARCAHTHYLAADPQYNKLSPVTFIYYQMIDKYKTYRFLSWGITSEHLGVAVNTNLTNTKEEFGSVHNVVSVYEKVL